MKGTRWVAGVAALSVAVALSGCVATPVAPGAVYADGAGYYPGYYPGYYYPGYYDSYPGSVSIGEFEPEGACVEV